MTVVCSRYETFGLTLAEAMVQGCPIVATGLEVFREVLGDADAGLICRPEDPDDLAAAILQVLEDRELARAMGEKARLQAGRYDADFLAEKAIRYYRQVLFPTGARSGSR